MGFELETRPSLSHAAAELEQRMLRQGVVISVGTRYASATNESMLIAETNEPDKMPKTFRGWPVVTRSEW